MKKNNVLIELTPLLDVILIILFFILVQSEGRMGDFYEETREAFEAELAVYQAEMDAFMEDQALEMDAFIAEHAHEMEHLRGISADYAALRLGLEENAGVIMVSIASEADNSNNRWILVEADSHTIRIDLCWDTRARENASLEFSTVLANKIQNTDSAVVVLVFRFDSTRTFAADHRLVSGAIHIQRQFVQLVFAELDIRI